MLWLWTTLAFAGDGPWSVPAGASNVYVGTYHVRFRNVDTAGGKVSLDEGVATNAVVGVLSLGLTDRIEVEAVASVARSRHLAPDSATCTREGRPDDFCSLSQGLGPAGLAVKGVLLDEAQLRPLSVSLTGRLRSSDWVSESRGRLTALGEGQTDVGAALGAGRTATLGERGWYRVSLDVGYWNRFALERAPKVPGDEVVSTFAALVSPTGVWGVGPNVDFLLRPGGSDLGQEVDLSSPNGFASLRVGQLKVGGTAAFIGERGVTVSVSGYGTAWAWNNPTDSFVVSAGVGWYRPPGGRPPATP